MNRSYMAAVLAIFDRWYFNSSGQSWSNDYITPVITPELSIPNSEYIPSLQKMGRFQLENLIASTLFWTDSQKGKQLKE